MIRFMCRLGVHFWSRREPTLCRGTYISHCRGCEQVRVTHARGVLG